MSGVTPLIDTLLVTRLAQRVDLVPLKGQTDIAGPNVVPQVDEVTNDVRLPSRASLQPPLSAVLSGRADSGNIASVASPGEVITLSAEARVISSILDLSPGATPKILGAEPLWPHQLPPDVPVLAATLAHAVTNSGLFYESHLHQFAAGTRTLAQLALEPQARMAEARGLPFTEAKEQFDELASASISSGAVASIHPDAMSLVRQQLDLMAVPTFRWVGEAWPGTPMGWEIHEEPDETQSATEKEMAQRVWTTRLALTLPELGAVEVRLSFVGAALQLHLAAQEDATVAVLNDGGHELRQRFGALGLQLNTLLVETLAAESAASNNWKRDDAV
jgi:Flagellar hook-length control protein FliK